MTLQERQDYYDHLVAKGMPEVLAASMASQLASAPIYTHVLLEDEVWDFATWACTEEGYDFWMAIVESMS